MGRHHTQHHWRWRRSANSIGASGATTEKSWGPWQGPWTGTRWRRWNVSVGPVGQWPCGATSIPEIIQHCRDSCSSRGQEASHIWRTDWEEMGYSNELPSIWQTWCWRLFWCADTILWLPLESRLWVLIVTSPCCTQRRWMAQPMTSARGNSLLQGIASTTSPFQSTLLQWTPSPRTVLSSTLTDEIILYNNSDFWCQTKCSF
jgi:hypothetical protein